MASDLAGTPRSGLTVQACGDAHMSNFGVFASPERSLVFDVNDFDETLPGPWEWDVKRLAASLVVAGRDRGFSDQGAGRRRPGRRGGLPQRDADPGRYARPRRVVPASGRRPAAEGSRRPGHRQDRQAHRQDPGQGPHPGQHGRLRQADPCGGRGAPHRERPAADRRRSRNCFPATRATSSSSGSTSLLRSYRRTCRPIGVTSSNGSGWSTSPARWSGWAVSAPGPGSCCWKAVTGPTRCSCRPKKRRPRCWSAFVGKSHYANCGERVVAGQHLMQASSDIFLGWDRIDGIDEVRRDFYIRQLKDWKGSIDPERMVPDRHSPPTAGCAAGPWPGPTPAPATASPSPPTWGPARPSTGPSSPSPRPTPTKTSETTSRCKRRSTTGG